MQDFYQQCNLIPSGPPSSFVDILSKHALYMHELTVHKNNARGLMGTAVKMYKLNNEWVEMLCGNDKEFERVTEQLLSNYFEALCDYIVDNISTLQWKKKIADIVRLEAEFYRALGSCECSTQWVAYTV